MAHQLTEAEWDDLVALIAASPAERIDEALKRIVAAHRPVTNPKHHFAPRAQPLTVEGWLIHWRRSRQGRVRSGAASRAATSQRSLIVNRSYKPRRGSVIGEQLHVQFRWPSGRNTGLPESFLRLLSCEFAQDLLGQATGVHRPRSFELGGPTTQATASAE
jgi:hypothetical protein